ncbi:small multidrug efflux protein - like protein [Halorhodospira abdelmalekii]|uniref:small multi-drug export protein n=1 Tax=Halorhodospira abdelmalekii TaxID=421629 RepID=UPI00190731CD|nr:small multi-drug export protein [Halorhodospira abdelmalekii]MBK1734553.1 small multidrug efflux protein - like protein [Halorhodospira abdelmalekii]
MDLLLQYLLIFVLAATPWIELLIVIPAGAAMGLSLPLVTLTALIGNALPIFLIIALFRTWERRYGPIQRKWGAHAMRIWERYGLPGLAMTAPLVTGIHLAAVMSLALGSEQQRAALWMVSSLMIWAVVTALLTHLGVSWLRTD